MKIYADNKEASSDQGPNEQVWEEIFSKKEWGKYPSESVIRFIARSFYNTKDRNAIKILELGFGTGVNLWFCAREGFKVSSIEWSETGVERSKAGPKEERLSTQIEQIKIGDYLEKLDDFEDKSFDAWMDSYSLAYNDFEKTKQIIKRVMKKLKIGGKFFSITPSPYNESFEKDVNLGYHLVKLVSGGDALTSVIHYCDEEDLKRLYEEEGHKITSIKIRIQKDLEKQLNELYIIGGERYE